MFSDMVVSEMHCDTDFIRQTIPIARQSFPASCWKPQVIGRLLLAAIRQRVCGGRVALPVVILGGVYLQLLFNFTYVRERCARANRMYRAVRSMGIDDSIHVTM
jgi:hypothetical protein